MVTLARLAVPLALVGSMCMPVLVTAQQTPTRVMIRVVARDAKIIGTSVGGARVTVRDVASGVVLAEGVQQGSTGDTELIMRSPRERGTTVFDTPGAAGFLAELPLTEPTVVEIAAEGPLDTPHAIQRATKTTLLVPGRDVLGEGIVLELLGFRVELLAPSGGAQARAGQPIEVAVKLTMMCGCPTEPGGLWNADQYEVVARLVMGDSVIAERTLAFTGTESTFSTHLTPQRGGAIELQVLAIDTARGNFGMVKSMLDVKP